MSQQPEGRKRSNILHIREKDLVVWNVILGYQGKTIAISQSNLWGKKIKYFTHLQKRIWLFEMLFYLFKGTNTIAIAISQEARKEMSAWVDMENRKEVSILVEMEDTWG